MKIGVLLAGGSGNRFGLELPKQFYKINNIPIIIYSLFNFVNNINIDKVVVVSNKEYMKHTKGIVELYYGNLQNKIIFCNGGKTRQDSLYNGIIENSTNKDIVVSHCVARPIIDKEIINLNIEMIEENCCINTVKYIYDTMIYNDMFIDREKTFIGLTPQTFYADNFIEAYRRDRYKNFTCACSLMVSQGYKMKLLKTDKCIPKITKIDDIKLIESMVNNDAEYQNLFNRT